MQNQNNIDNIYSIINRIHSDSFSTVYLVINQNNQNLYAAKVRKDENQQSFNHELQMTTIASGLNNPNLIHLHSHGNGPISFGGNVQNKNYLILDYHQKGDLFKYIEIPNQSFIELHAKYIFDKILRGVQALHAAGICHRDLKLENILLDQNFNPIIIDFVFATNNNVNALNEVIGTIGSASPQIINRQVYNGFKADIFSLGIILFTLVTNRIPFFKASKDDKYYRLIFLRKFNNYWEEFEKYGINPSQLFKNLFERMVNYNENERPTVDQILQDPWFAEIRNLNNNQQAQLENQILNDFIARENQINQRLNQINQLNQENQDLDDH